MIHRQYRDPQWKNLCDGERGWLAGIFEGEGTARIRKAFDKHHLTYTLNACTISTDPGALDSFYEDIGGAIYYYERANGRLPRYDWIVATEGAEILLRQVSPFLHFPRRIIEARLGLLYRRTCLMKRVGRYRRPESTALMERFYLAFRDLHNKAPGRDRSRRAVAGLLGDYAPDLLPLLRRMEEVPVGVTKVYRPRRTLGHPDAAPN
jgi:hypothetical protein